MGVSYIVAQWLNSIGHNAIHISNEWLHTMPDSLIIEKAILENRIILTADMDFGQILSFTKTHAVSVIQFRIHDLSPEILINKLKIIFDSFSDQLLIGSVIITVQEHKIRITELPL